MRTTAELVELAKDGERDAIGELVERYQRVAVATAWTVVGDFHLAQDIAQESFVAAFRRLAQLRSSQSFAAWLLTSVRRRANRHLTRTRETTLGLPLAEIVVDKNSWVAEFEDILPMLRRLPDQEHEVISLRYLNGYSVRQIAAETNRPLGTVTKQLSRAIHRLQEMAAELER